MQKSIVSERKKAYATRSNEVQSFVKKSLDEYGGVSIEEIANYFSFSSETARRIIIELEKKKRVKRSKTGRIISARKI